MLVHVVVLSIVANVLANHRVEAASHSIWNVKLISQFACQRPQVHFLDIRSHCSAMLDADMLI